MERSEEGDPTLFPRTVEHNNDFRLMCRLAKAVNPEFYIVCTDRLAQGEVALDLRLKRIEASTHSDIITIIAGVMLHVGHLALMGEERFRLAFRPSLIGFGHEGISEVSEVCSALDRAAFAWAAKATELFFPHISDESNARMREYLWGAPEWLLYFSSK